MTEQLRTLLERAEKLCPEDAPETRLCITQALALLSQTTAEDAGGVVERVARAICLASGSKPDDITTAVVDGIYYEEIVTWHIYITSVQDAIAAYLAALPAVSQQPVLRVGDVIEGTDPDIGDLVLVPLNQMQDIKNTCGEIVKKCQYPVSEAFLPEKKELNDFKGDIFCLAEHAELFAGNWTQRKREALPTAPKQEG